MRVRDRRSSMPGRTAPGRVLPRALAFAAAWMIAAPSPGANPSPDPGPVLHLADGGVVPGRLGQSDDPGVLRWHGSAFAGPFDVRLPAVASVRWPSPDARPDPSGADCVELTTGDVLFGTLVGLDERGAMLDTPEFGRLRIAREVLGRIDRRAGSAAPVYFGPNGLSEWEAIPGGDAWIEEGGRLRTESGGASLRLDAGLPERAAVEVVLSWERKPSFILALGVGDDEESFRHAFRFEVWGPDLVAVRESPDEADIAWLGTVGEGPGHVRLRAFLDQQGGRLDVGAASGISPGSVTLGGPDAPPLPGIRLMNVRGDVRLERLIVRRWDGNLPPDLPSETPCIVRTDGTLALGTPDRLDAAANEFVLRSGEGEARVAADHASVLIFSTSEAEGIIDVVLTCHDGTRLSGTLDGIGEDSLALLVPGIDGPLAVATDDVQALSVPRQGEPDPADAPRTGMLELEGTRLRGQLVPGQGGARLAWLPAGGASPGPLHPEASGRIVYKDAPPAPPTNARAMAGVGNAMIQGGGMIVVQERIVVNGRVVRPDPGPAPAPEGQASHEPMLSLRSGDDLPAEVLAIDGEGVHFRSAFSERDFVPHDRMRSVSFAPLDPPASQPTEAELDRLLTLPRMQRGNPPTHLIRSRNGDFLRGRLIGLDSKWLRIEVRLEERRVPRAVVSEIRWLHPDLGPADDAEGGPGPEAEPAGPFRILAVRSDGVRLSFAADRVEDDALLGESAALGTCRIPLGEVDRLVLGDAIDGEAAPGQDGTWALRDAPDPQFVREAGTGGGTPGTESELVGTPAPEFALDLLDGTPFRLGEHRGEVVVLDFWATWCGPCLQAMPRVEEVAGEFRDRGVRLVAVNLQEGPEQIAETLRRHRLEMPVALDRDGAVAARYGVAAIPQTVIVDRDGSVARLFVGGGPGFADQLRDALQALTTEEGPAEERAGGDAPPASP